nr:MAG: hypothetical protein 1 [Guangxi cystovirus 19]
MIATNRKTLADLRQQQYDRFHNDPPGTWFRKANDLKSDVEITLSVGKEATKVGFNADFLLEMKGYTPDSDGFSFTIGAIPCAGVVDGNRFPSGLCAIVGQGNTGKTPLMHAIASEMLDTDEDYATIRFGEPLSGYETGLDVFLAHLSDAMTKHRVIVLDSLKDVLTLTPGAAASGGISRGAYQFVSALSNIAATRGCVILTAVNASSTSERVTDEVTEAIISNATCVVNPVSGTGDNPQWAVTARTGEGLVRNKWIIETKFDGLVLILKSNSFSATRSTSSVVHPEPRKISLNNQDLESALKRLYV